MKLPVEKEFRHDLEIERDKRLMRVVAYAMNDGLRTFPVNHARGLHKVVADYMESCALLEATTEIFRPNIDEYNEP